MSARVSEIYEELSDGKGVPKACLARAMRLLGMNPTEEKVCGVLQRADEHLGAADFKRLMEELLDEWLAVDQAEELLRDFKVFDRSGTGRMSTGKLVEIMSMAGNGFSASELEDMLLNAGVDGGTVDYKEVVYRHFFGAGSHTAMGDWTSTQREASEPGMAQQSLREVAKMKADRGQMKEAFAVYDRALVLLETSGQQSLVATTLHDMARLKESLGETEQALELYLRSLKIREEVLGAKHFYVATTLDAIANLKDSMGLVQEALDFACRSLLIWEHFFGSDHPHVGKILYNLAGRKDLLGDTGGSLDFYVRSLKIFQKAQQSDAMADALDSVAELTWRCGDKEKARRIYRRELRLRETLLGPEHSEVLELREFVDALERS